jgi:hypothetical protein
MPEYRRLPPEGWATEILESAAQFLGQTRLRPPGPAASKRPTRPPGMELGELDRWIKRGKAPPPDLLRPAVDRELMRVAVPGAVPGPRYVWLMLAAAVLDDADLFLEIVRLDYRRDAEAYRRQRAEGMGEEDLGRRPSPAVSADRLMDLVNLALDRTRGPMVDLLLGRLQAFRDAME